MIIAFNSSSAKLEGTIGPYEFMAVFSLYDMVSESILYCLIPTNSKYHQDTLGENNFLILDVIEYRSKWKPNDIEVTVLGRPRKPKKNIYENFVRRFSEEFI